VREDEAAVLTGDKATVVGTAVLHPVAGAAHEARAERFLPGPDEKSENAAHVTLY
jgi:hypothetical protein